MKNKSFRRMLFVLLVVAPVALVSGQSNERMDELLNQNRAELGHTAYVVLSAAELVDEDASPEDALTRAIDDGILGAGTEASQPVTFGLFSYLLMESFDVPGGVMYRIIPGPRYAAREVVYQGWSRTRIAPSTRIDGDTVVRILSIYLNEDGGDR